MAAISQPDRGTAPRPGRPGTLCIFDDAPIMGGAERFAVRLARCALRQGVYASVVFACPGDSVLARTAEQEGFGIIPVAFPDPRVGALAQMPGALSQIRRAISSVAPMMVLANTARTQFYVPLATLGLRRRPPLVHVVHEQDSAARASLRLIYSRTGRLEVIGANNAATYRQRLPGVEVRQVNNFLTDEEFDALSGLPKPDRPDPSRPVLGVLGRMIPEKGLVELLEELAGVGADSWGELRLAALPQEPEYERLVHARIAELSLQERVSVLGAAADAPSFLREVEILVVPSTGTEGQPTVILEALAAGRSVIVRRPLYSEDFAGLPVLAYTTVAELREALAAAPGASAPSELVRTRFGAEQALAAIAVEAGTPA